MGQTSGRSPLGKPRRRFVNTNHDVLDFWVRGAMDRDGCRGLKVLSPVSNGENQLGIFCKA